MGGLFLTIYLAFWFLSTTKIYIFKCMRKRAKKIFKNRMKYSFFNEIFYYTQLYVVYFGILQWSANRSTASPILNLALSIIFVMAYVGWLVFLVVKSSYYRKKI